MALSTFSVYGTIYSGWLGNSKYSLLGGLRAVSQLISYELIMSFTFLVVICFSRSANFSSIVLAQSDLYFVFPLWPVAFLLRNYVIMDLHHLVAACNYNLANL